MVKQVYTWVQNQTVTKDKQYPPINIIKTGSYEIARFNNCKDNLDKSYTNKINMLPPMNFANLAVNFNQNRIFENAGRRANIFQNIEGYGNNDNFAAQKISGLNYPQGKSVTDFKNITDLKLFAVNINHLLNKTDVVLDLMNKDCFDVIVLIHTQLKNRLDFQTHQHYKSFHQLCVSNKAGGISIFAKNNLKILSINALNEIEQYGNVWVTVQGINYKIAIGAVYFKVVDGCRQDERIDNIAFNEELWAKISEKTTECYRNNISVVICGDFNAHIGSDIENGGIRNNPHDNVNINGRNLITFTEEMGLINIFETAEVTEGFGTYYSGNRVSIIDYILWSPGVIVTHTQLATAGSELDLLSDHVPLVITINGTGSLIQPNTEKWRQNNVDWETFKNRLEVFIGDNPDLNNTYQNTKNFLTVFLLEYIGLQQINSGRRVSTREEKEAIKATRKHRKREREYWWKVRNNVILENAEELQNIRSDIRIHNENRKRIANQTKSLRQEKFFDKMCATQQHRKPLFDWVKRNSKPIYESVIKNEDGDFVTEPDRIKELLCEYWASIFINFEELPPLPLFIAERVEVTPELRNIAVAPRNNIICGDINVHHVKICCKKYKNRGDSGTSNLPTEMFKKLPDNLLVKIAEMFNQWWNTIAYPDEGRMSKVTLLPKPGKDHNMLTGYRTLSVGCNLCKLYLRVLETRLTTITEYSNLLGEKQNGFRSNRRGTDNLFILNTVNRVARKKGWKSFFTFIDLTKAFDRVDRDRLWQKMQWYGYPELLINNIRETYRNPTAILQLNGIQTDPQRMPIGLRQGCVLSPVLFAIYISDLSQHFENLNTGIPIQYSDDNNLVQNIKIDLLMYADDIVIISKNQYELKKQLKLFSDYCIKNKLHISEDKSFVFPINRTATDRRWPIYDSLEPVNHGSIPERQTGRYLGVEISRANNMFKNHIKTLKRKAQVNKWKLLTLNNTLDHKNWYGTIMWGTYSIPSILYGTEGMTVNKSVYTSLDLVQNNYLRALFRWNNSTAIAALWGESGLLPPSLEMMKQKLKYFKYIMNLPRERLVNIALKQQFLWETTNDICYTNSWWKTVKSGMVDIDIEIADIINGEVNIRTKIRSHFIQLFNTQKANKITLQYYDILKPRPDKHISHFSKNNFWLKAKVGGLHLNERTIKVCLICGDELEDLKHFLFVCPGLQNRILIPGSIIHFNAEEKVKYILDKKRTKAEKDLFGCCIRKRWLERNTFITEI